MSENTSTTTTAPTENLRERALKLDATDPLAGRRALFALDDGVYLDGNSLGALPVHVPARVQDVLTRQWGELRIRSWDESGWWTAPERIGDRIAPLVGAAAGQIVVGDSTSVNVFKAVVAAVRIAGEGRDEILVDATTFPTDGYIASAAARLTGHRIVPVAPADVLAALGPRTAAVLLNHVDYRSGQAARSARSDRRRPRGGRGRGVGPLPQRGRAARRAGRARGGPGRRLHLQVPERRPRFARVPVRRRASPDRLRLAAAGLELARRPVRHDRRLRPGGRFRTGPGRHARHRLHADAGSGAGRVGRGVGGRRTGQVAGPDGLLPGVRRGVRTGGPGRLRHPGRARRTRQPGRPALRGGGARDAAG